MTVIDRDGNITHVKGDTFGLTFIDVKLDGVLINWVGYKMELVVRTSAGSSVVVLELTEVSGGGIDLSVNGQIVMIKSATIMKTISARDYVYSWKVTNPSGIVDTWFSSKRFRQI